MSATAVYHLLPADPYKAGAWTYLPERRHLHQPTTAFNSTEPKRAPESVAPRHR
ncbi:hypothetical protein [Corynebacterium pelargi]|uniref:Uncharacterized protein n=1 Tax=Corynebacterium pelargi TaxID=1471400 RepID=A0A410W9T0_9CORY|nr:hypothetical protein [Corynebacterium pelargi]QAU52718.1 hypothetical protein CPELA_07280 [Corynebacterium pelargi]